MFPAGSAVTCEYDILAGEPRYAASVKLDRRSSYGVIWHRLSAPWGRGLG